MEHVQWQEHHGLPPGYEQGPITELLEAVRPFVLLMNSTSGRIPTELLSFANWHALSKAYKRING